MTIPNSVQCKKCKEIQSRSRLCVYCGNDIAVNFENRDSMIEGGVYV
jgi:ribosomal protein L32